MKKLVIASLLIVLSTLLPVSAMAQINVFQQCSNGSVPANDAVCAGSGGSLFGANGVWTNILNVLTFVGGAAAVIVIVMAGIRYIFSGGNASAVAGAKSAIIYAAIGLVVAVSANVVINFVLANVGTNSGTNTVKQTPSPSPTPSPTPTILNIPQQHL